MHFCQIKCFFFRSAENSDETDLANNDDFATSNSRGVSRNAERYVKNLHNIAQLYSEHLVTNYHTRVATNSEYGSKCAFVKVIAVS